MEYFVKPWQHQLDAIERAKALENFALFFEQGCGKTSTAINILRHWFSKQNTLLPTLILCPPIVIENWKREFGVHSNLGKYVVCLTGSQIKRSETLKKEQAHSRGIVAVTNYEALLMSDFMLEVEKWKPEVLILDESHKIKTHNAKRTKAAVKLSDTCRYKLLLSGTPILNSSMDIYSQFRVLDGGESFGKNFYQFRGRYFYDKNSGMPSQRHFPNWHLKPSAMGELQDRIASKAVQVKKSDCLDLPPLVRQVIHTPMTPEQERMYNAMKDEFIAYLDDKACVAQLAITKALRLMQIVSGFVKFHDGTQKRLQDTPRMAALRDLLETITPEHKVIIWAVFKENYDQIRQVCSELGIDSAECTGEMSHSQKMDGVDRFTNDSKCRVFFGHPLSGGIGINLVAASYSIWFSRNFSLEADLQAEARNHRGGSEIHSKITRIDLVTPNSIDEIVTEKLSGKEQLGAEMLRSLKGKI